MTRDVAGFLAEQQRKATGDLAQEWSNIEELYNKKLWHQLTLKLQEFVKHPSFAQGDGLVKVFRVYLLPPANEVAKMYENFLADFEHRINPLSFMEIGLYIVKQMKDASEAVDFLEKMMEKVKNSDEAIILCKTTIGNIKLSSKDMDGTKQVVYEAQELLDKQDGVTPVHNRFYELSSNYHKLMGNHAEYYRDALRFLGCTELSTIPTGEQADRAFNLGLAACLGKGVYNFGELLAHPVLESLKQTERSWLIDLLYAFNSGDIPRFDQLKMHWQNQADLASHELQMRQKISLLCLMEMTFKRPATNRQLEFQEIADTARLPVNEVELLVMKALSLGLVKGSIDQVDKKVHMTWVQPRVLDRNQISTMVTRLQQWCEDVKSMENLVENKAHDILT